MPTLLNPVTEKGPEVREARARQEFLQESLEKINPLGEGFEEFIKSLFESYFWDYRGPGRTFKAMPKDCFLSFEEDSEMRVARSFFFSGLQSRKYEKPLMEMLTGENSPDEPSILRSCLFYVSLGLPESFEKAFAVYTFFKLIPLGFYLALTSQDLDGKRVIVGTTYVAPLFYGGLIEAYSDKNFEDLEVDLYALKREQLYSGSELISMSSENYWFGRVKDSAYFNNRGKTFKVVLEGEQARLPRRESFLLALKETLLKDPASYLPPLAISLFEDFSLVETESGPMLEMQVKGGLEKKGLLETFRKLLGKSEQALKRGETEESREMIDLHLEKGFIQKGSRLGFNLSLLNTIQ